MQPISYDELLEKARLAKDAEQGWHHHYLPPDCALNVTGQHQLIFEPGDEAFFTSFPDKPMPELEQLENLFFNRTQ